MKKFERTYRRDSSTARMEETSRGATRAAAAGSRGAVLSSSIWRKMRVKFRSRNLDEIARGESWRVWLEPCRAPPRRDPPRPSSQTTRAPVETPSRVNAPRCSPRFRLSAQPSADSRSSEAQTARSGSSTRSETRWSVSRTAPHASAHSVPGCLKDLKRFWKLDENDEDRTVARIFHQVGLLKNDLVPILLSTVGTGTKGDRIALACGTSRVSSCSLSSQEQISVARSDIDSSTAELIAALTWPIPVLAELHSAQKLDELEKSLDYTSLITAQLEYKAIILRTGVLPGFLGIMGPSLEKNRRERQEKDENIISLILHVFRNLAAMRDRPSTLSVSAASMEETTLQVSLPPQPSNSDQSSTESIHHPTCRAQHL